jgi:hypothetical protein
MKTLNIQRNPLVLIALLLALLALLLTGCTGVETPTPTASPTVTLIPTATASPPTPTQTATATATAEPTGSSAAVVQAAATSGDRAAFVSETYPDNSVLEAGESFTKAFELSNAGSTTWTTDYALVRDETDPAGETLGAAERLALPQTVGPGESITLEIPLTAPEDPGTYTVYWTLQDANGAVVPVDGVQRVWATIRVCAVGQDCSVSAVAAGGASPSASGVSLTYEGVTHEGEKTTLSWCMIVENAQFTHYNPSGMSLFLDGNDVIGLGATGNYNCFESDYQLSAADFNQAQSVVLRIEKIEGTVIDTDEICEAVKPALKAQYPGLDFQCNYDSGNYYTGLQLPAGMTNEQAHTIIRDALSGAIYGPWDLIIK